MSGRRLAIGGITLWVVGCTAPAPSIPPQHVTAPSTPVVQAPTVPIAETVPLVALVEPYLVATEPEKVFIPPPALGGRIRMAEPVPNTAPLIAPAPSEIRPAPLPEKKTFVTPPVVAPAPKTAPVPRTLSPNAIATMVRLLEEERARSVETAKRQLAAATARATQTATEAKTTADLVRSGALAQIKANQAAAAAKEAASEQADAQKALEDAQQRQRESRKDVETALKGIADIGSGMTLAAEKVRLPAYQAVPYTYRLSILGSSLPGPVRVEHGTLGRTIPTLTGEAGAWIVRCADPAQLSVKVGDHAATILVRKLPPALPTKPGV